MNRLELEDKLILILRRVALGGSQRPITADVPFGESGLGLDSLTLVRFVLEVENSFGIIIPDEVWDKRERHTIGSFAEFIPGSAPADFVTYTPVSSFPENGAAPGRDPGALCDRGSLRDRGALKDAQSPKRTRLFENLREDLRRARVENVGSGWWSQHIKFLLFPGMLGVVNFRFCHWARGVRIPIVRHVLLLLAGMNRALTVALTGINISPKAQIGPGLVIHTNYAILVSPTTIGANCTLQTGVLIGYGVRKVGDDVYFGPGAKVVGKITIGDNVVVAPNSVVMNDVPDNVTVVGVPARIQFTRKEPLSLGRPMRKRETAS